MNPENLVDAVIDALADAGVEAIPKRADPGTGQEVVTVMLLPAVNHVVYMDGAEDFDQRFVVSVRRWSEAMARDDCYTAYDALMDADLSGEGYEWQRTDPYEDPAETGIDNANFYVWAFTLAARVTTKEF